MADKDAEADALISKFTASKAKEVIVLREDLIKDYSAELVDYLIGEVRKYKDFNMANSVLKQLIELKRAYWPAAQTNKNLNVNVFDEKMKQWIDTYKTMKPQNKEEMKKEITVTIDSSYKEDELKDVDKL